MKKDVQTKPFSVIETGGKQYIVSEGDIITIEKLSDEMKKGDIVSFESVLLTDNGTETKIGTPKIDGAKVSGEVVAIGRNKKIFVIRYKAKSNYFKKNGHRQPFVKVKITKIA